MTPRTQTRWTVLRYTYPDSPLDPQDMWRSIGLPDNIHMIWTEAFMVMELWYGGRRHQFHTLEQLIQQLNITTPPTHEDSTHYPTLLDG